jgi:asparagine synthase (glutamine-hydrolysing)
MCGIAGIITSAPGNFSLAAKLEEMNALQRHRGPDSEGYIIGQLDGGVIPHFGNDSAQDIIDAPFPFSPLCKLTHNSNAVWGFAHRRLSIIDTSAGGHQPMSYHNKQLWITYNGEIYNYRELRIELEQLGHRFITQTDTEVILAAYLHWGEDCLHRFNGMWAFVIYDQRQQSFFAARDRFGVKPFYYFASTQLFAFASEQKALVQSGVVPKKLNHLAVADYFLAGEIELQTESFFKDILELFPGHCMRIDANQISDIKVRRWYELKSQITEQRQPDIEAIRELLIDSIRIRMRSDVPVGSCLSGGIDSSAIVGIISHLITLQEQLNIGDQLKVFTAAFDDAAIDERKWANEVVNRSGAQWHIVQPTADEFVTDAEQLIYSQDVPIWSTSTYAQFRTMKLAAQQGIKVVLDGQGGDELFAGYRPYYIPFWNELLTGFNWSRLIHELKYTSPSPMKYWIREQLKQNIVTALPISWQLNIQDNYFGDLKLIDPDLVNTFKRNYEAPHRENGLNAALYNEFTLTRLKGYLKCEDRAGMWHSVESRTPFADDHRLIEYMFAIPGTEKIRSGVTKTLLRQAAAPFIPKEIAERKDKLGYATPNNKWISEQRDAFRSYFEQDFSGVLNKMYIQSHFDTIFNVSDKPENGRTFKFMAFAIWKKVMGI